MKIRNKRTINKIMNKFINYFVRCFIIFVLPVNCQHNIEFNSNLWKNWEETEESPNLRWRIYKDLLRQYDLDTFNRDQIIQLLGRPDQQTQRTYYYYLGYTTRGIEAGMLKIEFDINNKVEKISVIEY